MKTLAIACVLTGVVAGGCQQTLVLDDLAPDAGLSGVAGMSGKGGAGGGPTDASADGHCFGNLTPITAVPDVPQVVVALDRSTGAMMNDPSFGANEFLTAVSDLSSVVSRYQGGNGPGHNGGGVAISFYYLDFPDSTNSCNAALGCCSSDVQPTPSSQAFQDAAYFCNMSGSNCVSSSKRPIAAALSAAESAFLLSYLIQPGPRFVLLVTGGSPPQSPDCFSPSDCQSAINAVGTLTKNGVATYTVGMGDQMNVDCLQAMANAEGSQQYYSPAQISSDLVGTLENVVTVSIAPAACHMTLMTTTGGTNQLGVTYQGSPVNPDFKNGWTLDTDTGTPRLVLHGSACTMYVESPFGLNVYNGCAHSSGNP